MVLTIRLIASNPANETAIHVVVGLAVLASASAAIFLWQVALLERLWQRSRG